MQDPNIIMYQHNYYKPILDRAIKITETYVSDNKLILTGGQSIDLALRAHGKSIYTDDQFPDFDIVSDHNLQHAHQLAKLLCEDSLPNVSVINAFHITTVRVRTKRDVLLDSTYVPPKCYEKIPFLDVGHLRIIHPHYQFIDQRLSLATPLLDSGISLNVFNRLKKDVERNTLLRTYYPIVSENVNLKTREIVIPLNRILVESEYLKRIDPETIVYTGLTCVSGYLAYAIMMNIVNPNSIPITVSEDSISLQVPEGIPISLLAYDMQRTKSFMKSPDIYRPILNLKPITLVEGDFELSDTYGSRLACNIIEIAKGVFICVASPDYILYEFLRDRIYVSREPYSSFYVNLLKVVDDKRSKDSCSLWWPSLDCYGFDNMPEYRAFALELLMDPVKNASLKPKHQYMTLGKCNLRRDVFEYENSHYFLIDGSKDPSLDHTNYKYITEAFAEFIKTNNAISGGYDPDEYHSESDDSDEYHSESDDPDEDSSGGGAVETTLNLGSLVGSNDSSLLSDSSSDSEESSSGAGLFDIIP